MPDWRRYYRKISFWFLRVLVGIAIIIIETQAFAQQAGELEGRALYDAVKEFKLQGKATVSNLKLKRDLGDMTFTGDFYFSAPVNGRVTGAVFIGEGVFRAEAIESDFKTAVLRFTDDTLTAPTGMSVSNSPILPCSPGVSNLYIKQFKYLTNI